MTTQPAQPFRGQWPQNSALIFDRTEDFFAALFGPACHDAHVRAWRQHVSLVEKAAEYDARWRTVQQHVNEIIARERAS